MHPNRARIETEEYPVKVASGIWLDRFTFQKAETGKIYRTVKGAEHYYHLPRKSVERATREATRFLRDADGNRRTIEHFWAEPAYPRNCTEALVLLDSDLDEFKKNRQPRDEDKVYRNSLGVCLTDLQVQKRYKLSKIFCQYWRERDSRLRPGEKALRAWEVPNAVEQKGSPGLLWINLQEDVEAILAKKESDNPGVGRGASARLIRSENTKKDTSFLKSLLVKHGPLRRADVVTLTFQAGLTLHRLIKAKRELGIAYSLGFHRPFAWRLPDQQANFLPAKPEGVQKVRQSQRGVGRPSVREEIITAYRQIMDETGLPPSESELSRQSGYSRRTVSRALAAAALKNAVE
jgi:hypothetical protein